MPAALTDYYVLTTKCFLLHVLQLKQVEWVMQSVTRFPKTYMLRLRILTIA